MGACVRACVRAFSHLQHVLTLPHRLHLQQLRRQRPAPSPAPAPAGPLRDPAGPARPALHQGPQGLRGGEQGGPGRAGGGVEAHLPPASRLRQPLPGPLCRGSGEDCFAAAPPRAPVAGSSPACRPRAAGAGTRRTGGMAAGRAAGRPGDGQDRSDNFGASATRMARRVSVGERAAAAATAMGATVARAAATATAAAAARGARPSRRGAVARRRGGQGVCWQSRGGE
jgi:hypothetical protein